MIAVCVSTRLVTYCEGLAHCEAGTGCNGVDIFRNVSKDAWFLAKPQLANIGLAWTTGYFVYSISICNCILLCSIRIQYLQSSLVICNSALFCLMPQHFDACCCVVSVSLSSIQHTSELSRLQHPQINISVTKFLRFSALRGYCFRWKRSPISCCPVLSLSRSCQPVKSAGPMCRRICEKKTIIYGKACIYIYTYIKKKYKGTAVGSKDITGIKKTIKTAISLRFQLAASRKPALSHVNVFKRDKKQAWFEAGSWHATHKPVRYLTREPYTYQVIRIQRKLGWETSDAQGF